MKAGFIGYRHFAAKLYDLFKETGFVKQYIFYHPTKTLEGLDFTNDLNVLFDCDFIVVASPDTTHVEYLRELKGYKGYIFCEKIPAVDREGLKFLKSYRNPRLYYNFNYRKSELCQLLEQLSEEILHIDYKCGFGLALRPEYKLNWRSKASNAFLGVFQLTGIHLFDLLLFCFGKPKYYRFTARNISPYGDSVDNFGINMEFANGVIAELFLSYTSAYYNRIDIITSEKLISWDNNEVIVKGPREIFDEKGLFKSPPVISRKTADFYNDSLKSSVGYFISAVKSKQSFSEASSERNLLSNEIFLDILEDMKNKKK
ncbi:MAG TPA: Gfo/Idh/MocA family oxidoreductase [Candidatus Omnitrophota bacterium]|nr:Gfo/Idh/MocA family oxidoreductase [Candidatus Omnitrophota bacterium]